MASPLTDRAALSPRLTIATVLLVVSGAVLVYSLQLGWWGVPMVDPFTEGITDFEIDPYFLYGYWDVLWLVAGLLAFGAGLAALATQRAPTLGVIACTAGGVAVVALTVYGLFPGPDYVETHPPPLQSRLDEELELERLTGTWVALGASVGILAGALLGLIDRLRGRRMSPEGA